MKSYASNADEFRRGGLIVPVTVRQLPEAIQAGLGGPIEPAPLMGMIDSGAGRSMIRVDKAKELGLPARGQMQLSGFKKKTLVDAYPAIVCVQGQWEDELRLGGGAFDDEPGLEFLIGRDILQHAAFTWEPTFGRYTLMFPDHPGDVSP